MLNAIGNCVKERQHMPALVLIYSLIDSIAWAAAERRGPGSVRSNFEAWVKQWLLPELSVFAPDLDVTDLYAARCAVLHTLTGTSDLFSKGQAKRIAYAWGNANVEVLRHAFTDLSIAENHVALHYEDLHESLRKAIASFFTFVDTNAEFYSRIEAVAKMHYAYISENETGAGENRG